MHPDSPKTPPSSPPMQEQPLQTPPRAAEVPEPSTPVPPAQFKRQEMSPSSDIQSPEHKRPHTVAAPLSPVQSSFPVPRRLPEHHSGPTERFGHMHSFTSMMRRTQLSGSHSKLSAQARDVPEEDAEMEERETRRRGC